MKRLSIIGAGTMGTAFIAGVIQSGILSPADIVVSDHSKQKLSRVRSEFGVTVVAQSSISVRDAETILVAVKPQDIHSALSEIVPSLSQTSLVISIAAGILTSSISKSLMGHQPIVRAMPNLAASVGKSMTGWFANEFVTENQKQFTKTLFKSIGREMSVANELSLNAITAISGSGPAYIFYFIEHFMGAAVALGVSEKDAQELVYTTIEGAMAVLNKTGRNPADLRAAVTSKGGTTERAIAVFEKHGLDKTILEAVSASGNRAWDLSHEPTI